MPCYFLRWNSIDTILKFAIFFTQSYFYGVLFFRVHSSQFYSYRPSVFHNTHCQSNFTENHDINVHNFLISSCLIVALSRLELGNSIIFWNNQPVEICYSIYRFMWVYIWTYLVVVIQLLQYVAVKDYETCKVLFIYNISSSDLVKYNIIAMVKWCIQMTGLTFWSYCQPLGS